MFLDTSTRASQSNRMTEPFIFPCAFLKKVLPLGEGYPLNGNKIFMLMNTMNKKLFAGLLSLVLATAMVQGTEPTINCAIKMEITYTGILYQSTDGEIWTEVEGASNPYYVPMDEAKKLFFRSKGSESKNITIPLSDNVNLDMVWIQPGTFIMGSPEDELGRSNKETQHQVTLKKGYWLGKYEVTQAQYEAIIGSNPSHFKGDDLPVEVVNWNDAMEFCAKLTAIEKEAGRLPKGYEYTLPTDAQWEYACRAGTTTALSNGKDLTTAEWNGVCNNLNEVGWYVGNSDGMTHPVGQKKPNAWGLYDMHGNVFELCLDWYGAYPTTAVTDPTGPDTGSGYVVRGGCYYDPACNCRSSARGSYGLVLRSSNEGFRVALSPVK